MFENFDYAPVALVLDYIKIPGLTPGAVDIAPLGLRLKKMY